MDSNEIRKWHSTFKRDDELFEIRVLGDRTWSGYFYDVEIAIKELEQFDNCNIYYSLNEVKAACASREQFNCFKQVKGTATSKQDIEHRWWLAIDVDCERPSGVSSTDAEKAKAHRKAQEVFRFLRENGFSEPVVCDSSSGYHIIYPIDMDNTQESEDAIKAFLEILSNHFSDEYVKIDKVLHDANRILRLSGSFGRKGRSTSERPHRLAKILSVPQEIVHMGIEKILSFNEKYAIKVEQPQRRSYNGVSTNEQFNLRDFIAKNGIEVAKEVPLSGGGVKYVLRECIFDQGHKAPDAAIFEMANGAIAYKCLHNSCSCYDWRAVRLHFDPHAYDYENQVRQPQQVQYKQIVPQVPQKPKYEIKTETPELGKKWLSLSDIEKIDVSAIPRVKTGILALDRLILGLAECEVTLLSGSNSSGKSSWLNTLVLNFIEQGWPCALFSGELPPQILKTWIQMVAAGKANLRPSTFNDGKYYVPNEVSARIDTWTQGKLFLFNNEYGNTWEEVLHDMKELANVGVKVFILDNLMSLDIDLLEGDRNNKQKMAILQIKKFSKETNSHVILVAHPRKSTAFLRKNDISGTSDLTNAVDNVFIFHRVNQDFLKAGAEFYGQSTIQSYQSFGNVVEVSKNRMFGVCDVLIGMYYEIESRRFKNYEYEAIRYGWENEQPIENAPQYIQSSFEYNTNDNAPIPEMPFGETREGAPF